MRFNRLDLNLLVALDVLLSEKSITRGAKRLHLSQSATSGALARLRDYFQDELLTPMRGGMVLTPLASSLVEPVREVLFQIQATIEIKPAFDPATGTREFRILASDYVSTVLLGEAGRRISTIAPGITLDILPTTPTVLDELERGEVDIVILPKKFISDTQPSALLYEESYTCIVWAGNDAVGNTLSLDQYMGLGHVSTHFGNAITSFEEWYLRDQGYERRIEIRTTNFASIPHFLIGSKRVATMHTRLARTLARYYPIRLIAPPLAIPKVEICMQWNRLLDRDPSHLWLRALLGDVASAEPGFDAGPRAVPLQPLPGFSAPRAQLAACA